MPQLCSSHTDRRWWQFVPSLLVFAGITYLSLIKEVPFRVKIDVPLVDKWEHMIAYLVFALCLTGDSFRARMSVRIMGANNFPP